MTIYVNFTFQNQPAEAEMNDTGTVASIYWNGQEIVENGDLLNWPTDLCLLHGAALESRCKKLVKNYAIQVLNDCVERGVL